MFQCKLCSHSSESIKAFPLHFHFHRNVAILGFLVECWSVHAHLELMQILVTYLQRSQKAVDESKIQKCGSYFDVSDSIMF